MLPRREADAGQGSGEEAIPSATLPPPSLARMTRRRMPSRLPSSHGSILGREQAAGFIAVGHEEGPSDASTGDGRDVGIGAILERRGPVFTCGQCWPVDNGVGVTVRTIHVNQWVVSLIGDVRESSMAMVPKAPSRAFAVRGVESAARLSPWLTAVWDG